MGTVVAAAAVADAAGDVEGALEPYRTVDAVEGALEPYRTVDAVEGVLEPNRTVGGEGEGAVEGEGDVEEGVGDVEGAIAELEDLAVAGLITASAWIFGKSSGNCRLAPFLPSLTAIGYSFCKALWRSAVVGREERSSSIESCASSVATPKLFVSESALLAVSSVKGYIRLPAVISFCDREHVYTPIEPCSSLNCSTNFDAT